VLESLEGASSIQVHGQDGSVRDEAAGGELREGDSWDMPPDAVGRLIFRQGSQVLLTGGSRVEVREELSDQGTEKIPSVLVAKGEVRTLVDPASAEELAAQAPGTPKRLRFMIRTRSSVMGVRGTDFIVEASEAQSSVHTMTGTVDVGRDVGEVKTGKATPVAANQFTEAHAGQGVTAPRSFEPGSYLNAFHQKHPRMQAAYQRAAADSGSGRLKQRFQQIHQQRAAKAAAVKKAASAPGARQAPAPKARSANQSGPAKAKRGQGRRTPGKRRPGKRRKQ
jgi:hypothetical protein